MPHSTATIGSASLFLPFSLVRLLSALPDILARKCWQILVWFLLLRRNELILPQVYYRKRCMLIIHRKSNDYKETSSCAKIIKCLTALTICARTVCSFGTNAVEGGRAITPIRRTKKKPILEKGVKKIMENF